MGYCLLEKCLQLIQTKELQSAKYDPVDPEKQIRGIEKVITVIEIPGDKRVNIAKFYLTSETDIQWNIVKNRLLGPDFTSSRFLRELTTTLQIAKWESTTAHGAVAQSTSSLPVLEN